jgi:ATP-dependent RNA helicase RhlE
MLFEELSLSKSIQKPFTNKAIYSYTTRKSIPLVLAGNDLIGCAQTGTGKQRHLLYQLYIIHRIVFIKKKLK